MFMHPPCLPEFFEQLCADLFSAHYSCRFQLNGRRGDRQNGVDAYSQVNGKYIGLQCKHKDTNPISKLTISEIVHEIRLASKFKPKLSNYIICTTYKRSAKLQEEFRTYIQENDAHFTVELFFWDDINIFINKYQNVYKKIEISDDDKFYYYNFDGRENFFNIYLLDNEILLCSCSNYIIYITVKKNSIYIVFSIDKIGVLNPLLNRNLDCIGHIEIDIKQPLGNIMKLEGSREIDMFKIYIQDFTYLEINCQYGPDIGGVNITGCYIKEKASLNDDSGKLVDPIATRILFSIFDFAKDAHSTIIDLISTGKS